MTDIKIGYLAGEEWREIACAVARADGHVVAAGCHVGYVTREPNKTWWRARHDGMCWRSGFATRKEALRWLFEARVRASAVL